MMALVLKTKKPRRASRSAAYQKVPVRRDLSPPFGASPSYRGSIFILRGPLPNMADFSSGGNAEFHLS